MKTHIDMMHQDIEDQEIIERYVRNRLTPEERRAFEEHFFGCDECFEKVQATERFASGIRDAASRGLLGSRQPADATPASWWRARFVPAFAISYATLLVLAPLLVLAWMFFFQMPSLRKQEREAAADASAQRERIAALEKQLASPSQAEINVPFVMLQATRDAQAAPTEAILSPDVRHLTLWIELPSSKSGNFLLEINTVEGHRIQNLENLKPNAYGALVVSLPAEALQSGTYLVRLSRQEPSPVTLLAEYRLRIRKP